jgi:membrane protein
MLRRLYFFFKSLILDLRDAEISLLASSMAFTTVLSFVPWLAISLSLMRISGTTESILKKVEPLILDFFLSGPNLNIIKPLQISIERVHSGVLGVAGVVAMVITTFKLFHDLDRAQTRIWRAEETRSWWKRILIYSMLTFTIPMFMVLIFSVMGPVGLNLMGTISKDIIGAMFLCLTLFVMFKWWPIKHVSTLSALISALWCVFILAALDASYAVLVKKVFRFGKVYGGLASVPMFLVWLQLVWLVILFGVAMTASLEKTRRGLGQKYST